MENAGKFEQWMHGRMDARALTPGGVVGHAERGEAVGALDVEHVEVLRVRDVAVVATGAAGGEALEDLPRHGARVAARRRRAVVLRQHHRTARHHGVLDLAHCLPPRIECRPVVVVSLAGRGDDDPPDHMHNTLFFLSPRSPLSPPLSRARRKGSRGGSERVGGEPPGACLACLTGAPPPTPARAYRGL